MTVSNDDLPEIVCGTCGLKRCGPDVHRDDLCVFCALEQFPVLEKEVERLTAKQKQRDEDLPYWQFHAMADALKELPCEVSESYPCSSSGDCITEWCNPCAAKAWFASHAHNVQPNKEGGG